MIRRNIQERVRTITPFLRLDHDPYLVISDGGLFWIQDAYTTSDYFPYAQPVQSLHLNYIRNSVKVVVDAYNGTVDFYLIDSADPIAATYQRMIRASSIRLRAKSPTSCASICRRTRTACSRFLITVFAAGTTST